MLIDQLFRLKNCVRLFVGDFDDLLDKEEYKDIDKIKTIGTTVMLASGKLYSSMRYISLIISTLVHRV